MRACEKNLGTGELHIYCLERKVVSQEREFLRFKIKIEALNFSTEFCWFKKSILVFSSYALHVQTKEKLPACESMRSRWWFFLFFFLFPFFSE